MRNNCDFMVVSVDDEKYDLARGNNDFSPTFEEKAASLGVLRFPDGRGIDLVTETHYDSYENWMGGLYLPYALTGDFFVHEHDRFSEVASTFSSDNRLALLAVHLNLDSKVSERLLRLKYFVSSNDVLLSEKCFAASCRGIPAEKVKMPRKSVHVSDLVEKFNLTTN